MKENLLLIICAVGVVALIYLIRYIIAKVVYKGTDAIENKLRQIEPGTRATGNQSLAERLGVPGQNPGTNQIPASQPQSAQADQAPTEISAATAQQLQAATPSSDCPVSFCAKCGAQAKPDSTFCAKCGAELKKN